MREGEKLKRSFSGYGAVVSVQYRDGEWESKNRETKREAVCIARATENVRTELGLEETELPSLPQKEGVSA